jgi:hypothetical protein
MQFAPLHLAYGVPIFPPPDTLLTWSGLCLLWAIVNTCQSHAGQPIPWPSLGLPISSLTPYNWIIWPAFRLNRDLCKSSGTGILPVKRVAFCQRNRTGWKPIPLIWGLLQRSPIGFLSGGSLRQNSPEIAKPSSWPCPNDAEKRHHKMSIILPKPVPL